MRKWFILFIIAALPLAVSADEVKYGDLWYNTYEEDATTGTAAYAEVISSRDYTYSGDITIPASIVYNEYTYPVTAISERAFESCSEVTSVVISEGIKTIGLCAFMSCNNMTSVMIPSSVTQIDPWAFSFCNNLVSVISKIDVPFEIDQSVFSLNNEEVEGKTVYTPSQAILYVPEGKTSSYQSFTGWNMFIDILEGDLIEGTDGTFNYACATGSKVATLVSGDYSGLSNITIPSTATIDGVVYAVKTIGKEAFFNCYNLESVTFSEGLNAIRYYAFGYCYNAEFSSLPSSIKVIDDNAFFNCNRITNLVIPDGCTTIGNRAFESCFGLVKLELPKSLTSIGDAAFGSAENLAAVISHIEEPFDINKGTFCKSYYWNDNVCIYNNSDAILYVPVGTKSRYQSIEGWNMFADIIEGEPKETTYEGLNYTYVEGNGTAIVLGRADSDMRKISVPATILVNNVNYSVKAIGKGAFRDNYIDTLIIASGVETIGKDAFNYCWDLKKVELPSTIKIIADQAFFNCDALKRIELPSSLDSIGNMAFYSCDNLMIVVSKIQNPFKISESVFSLDENWDYSGETSKQIFTKTPATLYVPNGTASAYKAIDGWNMFAEIVEGEPLEAIVNGLVYLYVTSNHTATVIGRDESENSDSRKLTIPATVSIGGANYSVKAIGSSAFIGVGVDTLIIESGLETIGRQAFRDCYSLRKIDIPASVTSIGDYAFFSCGDLSSVISRIEKPFKIDKSVFARSQGYWDEDGNYFSDYQKSRANLYVPDGTKSLYESTEGWSEMFSGTYEGEILEIVVAPLKYSYLSGSGVATVIAGDYSELTEVTIPASIPIDGVDYKVKEIGSGAFQGCSNLTSVTIESGVETIGRESFSACYKATFAELPSTITTIGDAAFNNCNMITNLTLPDAVKTIGNGAFQYCYGLTRVVIPASVTSLGERVFAGCSSLSSISVAEGNEKFESRNSNVVIDRSSNTLLVGCKKSTIPDGVEAIGSGAFENTQIASVQVPGSVKSIGYGAFQSCRNLTEVILSEGLERIENNAFRYCERLITIEFPSTMKEFGEWLTSECYSLQNIVSRIEDPKDINEYTFGEYWDDVYTRATLWVPKGKTDTYKRLSGWSMFKNYDEMLGDTLTAPTISFDGHYLTMTNDKEQRANIYYSTDGSEPTILYSDTVALSNLGVIQAISKRYGSYTVDTARYEITYVYDGVTARTASGGLLKNALEWRGTDKIEMLDIDGQLNDEDFATIRGLSKLTVLNMAASKIENSSIPSGAFADMKLEWYVSPYNFTSVGSGIFKGCDKLAALTWNSSSIELPEDVVTDVANPNMLVYAKVQAMIPYAMKNVIVNGVANNIVLVDSAGNNNFRCPEEFLARRITYTHNYQQETKQGQTQGWETLALPFTVSKITHETKGEITPFAVEGAERPFWLYELGGNGMEKATEIRANIPYLICMPNDDAYGDEYMLGGRVTFSATNVTITTSGGTTVSLGDRQFVPTYQRVASSSDVYALNVNEVVGDNPIGSVFVQSLREVRPFEAYSVHSTNRARIITVSSLGGGDATGINDLIQNNAAESADGVVKVYSLSGALIKQGKREEVLRSLPNGLYIINGKKIIK